MQVECQPVLEGSEVQGLASASKTLCDPMHITLGHITSSLLAVGEVSSFSQGFHHALEEPCLSPGSSCLPFSSVPGNPRVTSPSQDSEFDGC